MERLRGNTFLLLLLRGGCQVLLNPQEYGESKKGVTKPNMLADLIRLTNTNYQPAKIETLASYFSKYLSGDPPRSPSYLPFNNPAYQRGLESRIEDNYPAVLRQMDRFCRKYLTQENYPLRLLVAGLVDAILADDSFDGEFDVGEKTVSKADLNGETHFLLQPFLASIWSNILANHPDTSEGAETYLAWTEDAGYNSAREITTKIGTERAKKIAVSTDLPEEMLAETAKKEFEKSGEETKKAPADDVEAEPEYVDAEILDPPFEKRTVEKNGNTTFQIADKIYNIDHIENFYG